jgi:hypothetical protein
VDKEIQKVLNKATKEYEKSLEYKISRAVKLVAIVAKLGFTEKELIDATTLVNFEEVKNTILNCQK